MGGPETNFECSYFELSVTSRALSVTLAWLFPTVFAKINQSRTICIADRPCPSETLNGQLGNPALSTNRDDFLCTSYSFEALPPHKNSKSLYEK